MKKFDKKFTNYLFIIFVVILLVVVLKNIILDPFSVFANTKYESIKDKNILPNERFVKMKYILANLDKYDSFLIGSCTSNFMNLDGIENGKWYNVTFTNNTIMEMNRSLKILLAHEAKIKRILVQISESSLKSENDDCEKMCKQFLNFCSYPETKKEKIAFYTRYLVYSPFFDAAKYDKWLEGSKRNIFKGGSFIDGLPKNDFEISESEFKPELFYDKSFGTDTRDYNSDNISLLKEMYDLCKSRNIKFDIFFLPEYVSLYKNVDIDKFNSLKKQLVNFTPFYDFTGINAISTDKKYWQDPVHVNSWTSKLIVDRIFYEDKNQPPKIKNFGVYVTKKNFDNHIKNLNLEMEKYIKTNQK